MKRREFIYLLAGAVTWSLTARAEPTRIYRVAYVAFQDEAGNQPFHDALISVLRDRGYTLGRNILYEKRYANSQQTRVPALVDELLVLKPDVLVGIEQVARVMMSKTSTIPIVLINSIDPVAAGLVKSLSRPGGNVTGVSLQFRELVQKHLELLREIVPRLRRVGQFHDVNFPGGAKLEESAREAAASLGVEYVPYFFADRSGMERAFAEMARNPPDGFLPGGSALLFTLRHTMIDTLLRLRIPSGSLVPSFADLGALFSYGPSLEDSFRLAATYVDRILRGANPRDLPVEQPTKFELVINLQTAKHLGLTIPQSVLLRATRVIE
jgi:putative tryptophan/tyrosine transport system substrate-binding protein